MSNENMTLSCEEALTEFITKFDASRDPALWEKLIEEEAEELRQAVLNVIKEYADLTYVLFGYGVVAGEAALDRVTEKLDIDFMWKNPLVLDVMDAVDPVMAEAFRRVHESNMSKLGDDGKPLRREDGKILKGPNYKPPVLDDLLAS